MKFREILTTSFVLFSLTLSSQTNNINGNWIYNPTQTIKTITKTKDGFQSIVDGDDKILYFKKIGENKYQSTSNENLFVEFKSDDLHLQYNTSSSKQNTWTRVNSNPDPIPEPTPKPEPEPEPKRNEIADLGVSVGGGVSYLTRGGLIGVGVKGLYQYNETFAGQLAVHYFFGDNVDFFVDLDIHYDGFNLGNDNIRFTPFAGLNQNGGVTVKSRGNTVAGGGVRRSSLNLGVNAKLKIIDNKRIYIEPKIILGRDIGFAISTGLYF